MHEKLPATFGYSNPIECPSPHIPKKQEQLVGVVRSIIRKSIHDSFRGDLPISCLKNAIRNTTKHCLRVWRRVDNTSRRLKIEAQALKIQQRKSLQTYFDEKRTLSPHIPSTVSQNYRRNIYRTINCEPPGWASTVPWVWTGYSILGITKLNTHIERPFDGGEWCHGWPQFKE